MGASSNLGSNLTSEVRSRAGWGIFLGIVTAALGVLLIAYPLFAATVTTIFIGCILIIAGVLDIALALRAHKAGTFFARLLLGVVYGLGGLLLLFNPQSGVALLTAVLGVMLLIEAGATTALAFQVKPLSGWGWLLFDAVITAILGFLILAHWPASAVWPSEPWLVLPFWYVASPALPFPRACAMRRKDSKIEIFDRRAQHSLWLGFFRRLAHVRPDH